MFVFFWFWMWKLGYLAQRWPVPMAFGPSWNTRVSNLLQTNEGKLWQHLNMNTMDHHGAKLEKKVIVKSSLWRYPQVVMIGTTMLVIYIVVTPPFTGNLTGQHQHIKTAWSHHVCYTWNDGDYKPPSHRNMFLIKVSSTTRGIVQHCFRLPEKNTTEQWLEKFLREYYPSYIGVGIHYQSSTGNPGSCIPREPGSRSDGSLFSGCQNDTATTTGNKGGPSSTLYFGCLGIIFFQEKHQTSPKFCEWK
jgi:hypothetical protein